MKRIILILSLVLIWNVSFSQLWEKVYYVSGQVIDEETGKPVPYVLVVNVKKGNATQTDTAGRFLITMTKDDSLRFSTIGYYTKYWTLADKNPKGKRYTAEIKLKPRVYNLPSVDIYAVRWKAFVYEVAHTKVEKDETQERIKIWFDRAISEEDLKAIRQASLGARLFVIGGKTKYEKQLQQLQQMERLEQIEKKVQQKFNPQLVSTITGLQGDELDKFMSYLNFDRDFILKTPEYDLIVIIKQIYEEYKKGNLYKRSVIRNTTPFAPKRY